MRKSLKRIAALICATVALAALPALALATETETEKDAGGNPYSADDVAALRAIVKSQPSLSEYEDKPIRDWNFVYWKSESESDHKQRVWKIDLHDADISGSLDVSGLPRLDTLVCYGNKGLTSLTLPAAPCEITYLSCYNTGLAGTLDVSGCPRLKTLYCDRTNINALKVARLANLDVLYCFETNISALDVSGCTSLTELLCYYTNINALDVSDCTKLIELDIEGTNVTTLDISANSALEKLYCEDTPLESLTLTDANSALESLNVRGTNIELLDLSCLTSSQTKVRISDPVKVLLPEGATFTLLKATGGTIKGTISAAETNGSREVSLEAKSNGSAYEIFRWTGLPEGASADEFSTSFTLAPADAVTVSAEFTFLPEDDGEGEAATKPAIAQSGDATPLALIGAAALCAGAAALFARRREGI